MAKRDAAVVGVVSITAAGFVLVQAPDNTADLVSFALQRRSSAVNGIIGPTAQITAVLDGLSLRQVPARLHRDERGYGRNLANFSANISSDAEVRLACTSDVAALTKLRRAFLIEAVGAPDSSATDTTARTEAERMCRDGATFVLIDRGELVAMTAFSARYGKVIQIGAVYTATELRRRGYARAVVAGSLLHAIREWGSERAVLFTAEANIAAQRTYEGLGFERNGGFTLHFFREPLSIAETTSFVERTAVDSGETPP